MSASRSPLILACNVYISEGHNHIIIDRLKDLAASFRRTALLAHIFVDRPYNRTNVTFLSRSSQDIAAAATTLSRAALSFIDLRSHEATHPRLGVVDHISCHPLIVRGSAATANEVSTSSNNNGLDDAAHAAHLIGQQIASGTDAIPVYYYGNAHPEGRPLDALRRQLGYFKSNTAPSSTASAQQQQQQQLWKGSIQLSNTTSTSSTTQQTTASASNYLNPDLGPQTWSPSRGAACIGAVPFITNYNLLLNTTDLDTAKNVARRVSGRNGGIRNVQTMALQHEKGIEIACNLLSANVALETVKIAVSTLAGHHGIDVVNDYVTGKTQDELVAMLVEYENSGEGGVLNDMNSCGHDHHHHHHHEGCNH